jgi:hypothetical protein
MMPRWLGHIWKAKLMTDKPEDAPPADEDGDQPDHPIIWLEPRCTANSSEPRGWSAEPLEDCNQCSEKAVPYIRADRVVDVITTLEQIARVGAAFYTGHPVRGIALIAEEALAKWRS